MREAERARQRTNRRERERLGIYSGPAEGDTRLRYAEGLEKAYGNKFEGIGQFFLEQPVEYQLRMIIEAKELRRQYVDNNYQPLGLQLNYMIYYHSPV